MLKMHKLTVFALFLVALQSQYSMSEAYNGETDCTDVSAQALGASSGKYHVAVGAGKRGVWVYCDMTTDGGGWTVIQRRSGPAVDFYRTWEEYEQGFGNPEDDFWIGNTYLHSMTVNKRYVLRIELTDWDNKTCYAEYSNFVVGGAGCKYRLESIGEYCGDCGDSLTFHLGKRFSAKDQDYDDNADNCAAVYKGAWWYASCHRSNLNGQYKVGGNHATYADGINWYTGRGHNYSYKKAEMKIRPYNY